jgi:hypothetical protein
MRTCIGRTRGRCWPIRMPPSYRDIIEQQRWENYGNTLLACMDKTKKSISPCCRPRLLVPPQDHVGRETQHNINHLGEKPEWKTWNKTSLSTYKQVSSSRSVFISLKEHYETFQAKYKIGIQTCSIKIDKWWANRHHISTKLNTPRASSDSKLYWWVDG